jgi:hypothetical protein
MKREVTWRSWHLVAVFAVGAVIAWMGESVRDWAAKRLTAKWLRTVTSRDGSPRQRTHHGSTQVSRLKRLEEAQGVTR